MKPKTIAITCTGVAGAVLLILGVFVLGNAPMLVAGFVLILACSGLIWSRDRAALDRLKKMEERTENVTKGD